MKTYSIRSRAGLLGIALSMLSGGFAAAGTPAQQAMSGSALMAQLQNSYRYRQVNGGQGRGNVARQKRAAKRLQNIRARSKH